MGVSQSKLSSTAIVATLVGAELISSVPGCSAGTVVYSGLMRPTAYSHISGISSSRGAVTGKVAGGGYTECRKAGYKHYECNKQGKGYVGCRKAGYKHNECNKQGKGYLNCRKRGYKHYECKGQYEDTSDEDMDLYEDYED